MHFPHNNSAQGNNYNQTEMSGTEPGTQFHHKLSCFSILERIGNMLMASSTSARIIYWSYATNAVFQMVDVVAWLHPPLLCPQAREPVARMFVRGQSVLLLPLLIVFWLFRAVPLQAPHSDEAARTLSGIARGVAGSFVVFHCATVAWCAGEVYMLGTEMTKTHLIFWFHGFYAVAGVCAYRLSQLELKRI